MIYRRLLSSFKVTALGRADARGLSMKSALPFQMRSCFFPKKTTSCLAKTASMRPDVVILDLEDSVEEHEKPAVRKMYLEALENGTFSSLNTFVRCSPLNCKEDVQEDIDMFAASGIAGFILPKVESPSSVFEINGLISKVEKEKGLAESNIKLIPIVESPAAYFCLDKIALASERNVAIMAGSGDFTAEAVCEDHSPTYDAYFSKAVLAAKIAGIGALWGVHDKIDDHAGFENFCLKMKRCGFNGVVALTPKQISLANYIFSMSPRESIWINNVLKKDLCGSHLKVIRPSIQESRQMIGPPHRIKAKNMKNQMECLTQAASIPTIKGIVKSKGMSTDISIGEVVRTPHRVTVGESWKTLWDSVFLNGNRLHESVNGSKQHLPFTLAATMAVALSVSSLSYYARVHLGFKNIFQHRPLVTGDMIQAMYRIEGIKSKKGSDNNLYSIVSSTHWLVNQVNDVILQLEKVTMFSPDHCKIHLKKAKQTKSLEVGKSALLESMLQNPAENFLPLVLQPHIDAGQLLVHDMVKVMGYSETRMLCTLLRIVNPHHHNIVRYSSNDLLVPGPFVMSAAIANSALDLGEILYEDIPLCISPNKVNFGDQIGTLTYVVECREIEGRPNYEQLIVKHIAVKNSDMEILSQMDIPLELFNGDKMKPSEIEKLCANEFPILLNKIACIIVRRIIRVKPGLHSSVKVPQELC